MESYGAELTSPPLPLVALIGPPEALPPLADYLRTQHTPRLQSLGVPDAHSAAGAFGARKVAPSSAPPAGILKAGWLRKHRTSRPAVAALLVERESVVGDPSSWAWLVSQLDAVRVATKGRGARIVVIITQQAGAAEVPEDRIAMICRQAGIERRCVLTHVPSEGLPALQVVGRVLAEQAALFYATDAQRRLTAHAHRNVPSPDLNLRTAFKLGALAEFRADWSSALRMYGEAYGYLPQILAAAGAQPQRFAEVRAVAEQVHVKLVSLLLLALKQVPEALAQFDTHIRLFRRVPFEAPPGLAASHHAWLCRQHMVLAELLVSSGLGASEQLKREHHPGQLCLAAAQAAIERRKAAAFISGMHGGNAPESPGKVSPGQYVGKVALLPSDPAAAVITASGAALTAALAGLPASGAAAVAGVARRLSEDEFELYLESEECGVQHSKATVDLLRTAQDALARSGRRAGKTLQHCMLLLGHELLEAGDAAAAERLLTQVAGFYRRERWEGPLASALLLLRECHQNTHNLAAHAELSLEVSALEGSALDPEQRSAMATAAAAVLAPLPPLLDLSFGDASSSGGSAASITYQLPALLPEAAQQEQPASPRAGRPPPAAPPVALGWLRGGWAGGRPPFSLAAGFLPGRWQVEVPPQHHPPLLLVQAPESLLQGEQAAVTVTVSVGVHAIQGAVLQAKAVHVDSQQELGLLPTATSLAALTAGTAGAASAASGSPGAAGPGGIATALPPGASSPSSTRASSSAIPAGELRLGDLAAGQRRQLVLLLDARCSGPVDVLVELKYTAASHDVGTPGGTTMPEQGHCTVLLPVQVRVPWRLAVQLLGPPSTHTLLAAAVPAAGLGSSGGGGADGEPGALLAEQTQRLQTMSLQDGQPASAADLGAAADSRDLAMLLLRSLPPSFMAPLLTAELRYPPAATAGQAAALELLLSNGGATNQEVAVSVGDPHGFLLSGPKSTMVQLLPRSATTVTWHAAPYHIGLLPLPDITVTSAQHGQAAPVSRGCTLFVERSPEQVEQPAGLL
ncbi:hypothetical protein C2E21_2711 [Chlorella sorokiniana]|uniref:Trafficking protein particle complex subunit 11 domain-containing protein n=1 Tax=Chlorella sorokiniana TaxID=3076 RepID=A0A2P6TWA7_CHLSO|nr:hypothetical protein C2E21_2711 [Chlorella sorokiniana]|eukprot:PRW58338.1 hypothetical protein C2E21_2711 [Chlorella sorokiniana]